MSKIKQAVPLLFGLLIGLIVFRLMTAVRPASAQTTTSCGAGYCGNSLVAVGPANSTQPAFGFPFSPTGSLGVADLKLTTWSGTQTAVQAMIIQDSNSSGGTISGTVLCSTIISPTVANATNIFTLSGCGTLSHGTRYWAMINRPSSADVLGGASSGISSSEFAATYPTSTSFNYTAQKGVTQGLAMGIDLFSNVTPNPFFFSIP